MTHDEHQTLLTELRECTTSEKPDIARTTEILAVLAQDYPTILAEHEETSKNLAELQNEYSKMVVTNGKLFSMVGDTSKLAEKQEDAPPPDEQPTIDGLFEEGYTI